MRSNVSDQSGFESLWIPQKHKNLNILKTNPYSSQKKNLFIINYELSYGKNIF